jgi:hypothetical protein
MHGLFFDQGFQVGFVVQYFLEVTFKTVNKHFLTLETLYIQLIFIFKWCYCTFILVHAVFSRTQICVETDNLTLKAYFSCLNLLEIHVLLIHPLIQVHQFFHTLIKLIRSLLFKLLYSLRTFLFKLL